jgi:hypothetical protein
MTVSIWSAGRIEQMLENLVIIQEQNITVENPVNQSWPYHLSTDVNIKAATFNE